MANDTSGDRPPGPRRILFLDMDGVLNSHEWFNRRPMGLMKKTPSDRMIRAIDPEAVARLNQVVDAVPALEVVLSSAWRLGETGLPLTRQALIASGFRGNLIDRTPDLARPVTDGPPGWVTPEPRGVEIRKWLDDHAPDAVFAVVDDDSDMDAVRDCFVHTSFDDGLQDQHVEDLIALLRSPVPGWGAFEEADAGMITLKHRAGASARFSTMAAAFSPDLWKEVGRALHEALTHGWNDHLVVEAVRTGDEIRCVARPVRVRIDPHG